MAPVNPWPFWLKPVVLERQLLPRASQEKSPELTSGWYFTRFRKIHKELDALGDFEKLLLLS